MLPKPINGRTETEKKRIRGTVQRTNERAIKQANEQPSKQPGERQKKTNITKPVPESEPKPQPQQKVNVVLTTLSLLPFDCVRLNG